MTPPFYQLNYPASIRGTTEPEIKPATVVLGPEISHALREAFPYQGGQALPLSAPVPFKTRGHGGTRTHNFLCAKQVLYQIELHAHAPGDNLVAGVLPREHGGSRGSPLATPCRSNHRSRITRSTLQNSHSRHSTCASSSGWPSLA